MFNNLCESTNTKLINDCWDIHSSIFYVGYKMFSLKYGSLRTYWNSSHVQNWWCPNVGLACYCNISIRNAYNIYTQSEGSSVSTILFSPNLALIKKNWDTERAGMGRYMAPTSMWEPNFTELVMAQKWGHQINIDNSANVWRMKYQSSVSYCYKWWLGFQYSLFTLCVLSEMGQKFTFLFVLKRYTTFICHENSWQMREQ